MDNNNPFSTYGSDKTIIKPSAGRQAPKPGAAQSGQSQASPGADSTGQVSNFGLLQRYNELTPSVLSSSKSPLYVCATPLLYVGPVIRNSVSGINPSLLREELIESIKAFERIAAASGVAKENIIATRYILCTFLDESAANTPWGGSGVWAKFSLLVLFHKDTWGGEKVFLLLSKLVQAPKDNLDLLNVFYTCLGLGFEGKYKIEDSGPAKLREVRSRLFNLIRSQSEPTEQNLADNWRSKLEIADPTQRRIPLWLAPALGLGLIFAVFAALRLSLSAHTDPVFSEVAKLTIPVSKIQPPAPALKPPVVTLAGFLKPEIEQGLVVVLDASDRSLITIKGDGLFEPGSARLSQAYLPLMQRIGAALEEVGGRIVVTGHTDNQPIRSVQFPSNWHLSQDRAREVVSILETIVKDQSRLESEGRGDTEPVAQNDSAEGRALNRRVEVMLYRQEKS